MKGIVYTNQEKNPLTFWKRTRPIRASLMNHRLKKHPNSMSLGIEVLRII